MDYAPKIRLRGKQAPRQADGPSTGADPPKAAVPSTTERQIFVFEAFFSNITSLSEKAQEYVEHQDSDVIGLAETRKPVNQVRAVTKRLRRHGWAT